MEWGQASLSTSTGAF